MNQQKQVALVGALSAGMMAGIPLSTMLRAMATRPKPTPRQLTPEDEQRIEASRLKMQRKAAQRDAQRAKQRR